MDHHSGFSIQNHCAMEASSNYIRQSWYNHCKGVGLSVSNLCYMYQC